MKPVKGQTRLLLNGALAGTLPDATATGLAVQLRTAAGELLCARIPAGKFGRKGKKAVRFADKPGTLDGAGGLASLLLKTRKGGNAALTLAAKQGRFTTPPPGPLTVTFGFGDGKAPAQCSAVTSTFRAKKRGVSVRP